MMGRRLSTWLPLAIAFGAVVLGPQSASASAPTLATSRHFDGNSADPQISPSDEGGPTGVFGPMPTSDGYVYAYDVTNSEWIPVPVSIAGPTDPRTSYRWALSPACAEKDPFDDLVCVGATEFCAENGKAGIHDDVWRMEVTPNQSGYVLVGDICTGDLPDPVPARQVIDAAEEFERTHVPIAVPRMQPSNMALVNMPLLVNVTPLPVQTMAVAVPLPGELVATPSYAWSFDGRPPVAGAGLAFDGTDPRVDPGHYVSHTYVKAQPIASVSLTVTWTATFTAAGETVRVPDVVMPAVTMTYSVHEARSVLVSG